MLVYFFKVLNKLESFIFGPNIVNLWKLPVRRASDAPGLSVGFQSPAGGPPAEAQRAAPEVVPQGGGDQGQRGSRQGSTWDPSSSRSQRAARG